MLKTSSSHLLIAIATSSRGDPFEVMHSTNRLVTCFKWRRRRAPIGDPVSLKSKLPGATSENRARQLDLRIEDWKLAWSNGTKGR